jgi:hypothetical protein
LSSDLYALVALAARYWFAALMLLLLFRGWRMTVADNRRAKLLREWMGQTGCVGELIANPGARNRVSYPIPGKGCWAAGAAPTCASATGISGAPTPILSCARAGCSSGRWQRPPAVGGGHSGEAVFSKTATC